MLVRVVRRARLAVGLPALIGASTLLYWLAGRRLTGLWVMPDEAIYGGRALTLWRTGRIGILHGQGAGYGLVYPALAGLPLSIGSLATGYASLKVVQALVMSLVAVPIFFYGRRVMRPGYALLAAALALASPLMLYSGLVMTEVVMYPVGALALLAIARAVETATLRHQAIALALIAAAVLTRVQAVVLVAIMAAAVIVDALLARQPRRVRLFWPIWATLALALAVVAATPGVFGAYAATLRGHYPLSAALGLAFDHLAYLAFSTAVVPVVALVLLLADVARTREADRATRALVSVGASAVVVVVMQVGLFAARYAPHLLGRDLAMLPPLLFVLFALWLDRGAPRQVRFVLPATCATFAVIALAPWGRLVNVNSLPDTFGAVILTHVESGYESTAVASVAIVLLVLMLTLRRRWLVLLPAAMLALLAVSTVIAANNIRDRVTYDQRNLVGIPPNWIERATQAPTAYLYDGESYWNGVWQLDFWNRNITDVVSMKPSVVPGPLTQRVVTVPPDGRLPIRERYVVASDPHSFAGEPIAHVAQVGGDVGGLTLWRLSGPPRLTTIERGIQANGDMTEPGLIRAYDCAGGRLELTLLPKSTAVVTLRLDGRVVQRARIADLPYWNGTIFVPPSPSRQVCQFEIDGEQLLGSTRIVFVHR